MRPTTSLHRQLDRNIDTQLLKQFSLTAYIHKKAQQQHIMQSIANTVQLIGNLGKDVVINTFESGSKKATCTIATTEFSKNAKGEIQKNTTWHNIIAWGKNAELMGKVLAKGTKVMIKGSLANRSYEKDGIKHYVTEVIVHEFVRMMEASKEKEVAVVTPF